MYYRNKRHEKIDCVFLVRYLVSRKDMMNPSQRDDVEKIQTKIEKIRGDLIEFCLIANEAHKDQSLRDKMTSG